VLDVQHITAKDENSISLFGHHTPISLVTSVLMIPYSKMIYLKQ